MRNHEELLRKYNQKGAGGEKPEKKKERIVSFLPKLSESKYMWLTGRLHSTIIFSRWFLFSLPIVISPPPPPPISVETLEIKDTITVTAFGVPLPLVKPRYAYIHPPTSEYNDREPQLTVKGPSQIGIKEVVIYREVEGGGEILPKFIPQGEFFSLYSFFFLSKHLTLTEDHRFISHTLCAGIIYLM